MVRFGPLRVSSGHQFFGEWFGEYDPLKNDAVTGPAEEFRTNGGPIGHLGPKGEFVAPAGAIGYNEAKPGGSFLKPGVGVLRKVDDKPYRFGFPYPIVDTGTWTVEKKRRSILFRQVLNGPDGYADFFMIDGEPTGPGMIVHFAFEPRPEDPLGPAAKIEGKNLMFVDSLEPRKGVSAYLTGYSDKASDYDFKVEDTNSRVAVRQTSDQPLYRLHFWSTSTTICPEAYIHLNVRPGQTSRWKIQYQFIVPAH